MYAYQHSDANLVLNAYTALLEGITASQTAATPHRTSFCTLSQASVIYFNAFHTFEWYTSAIRDAAKGSVGYRLHENVVLFVLTIFNAGRQKITANEQTGDLVFILVLNYFIPLK